jgi:DNA-directed RNA polymerase subunit RPC12/RpoP
VVKDKRVKGCPNDLCSMHINRKKQPVDNNYCPKCASKLIFVCEKCFTEIEDIDYSYKKCKRCEAEVNEKKKKANDSVKNVAGKIATIGAAVVGVAAAGIQKEGVKQATNVGTKVVKKAVDVLPKVIRQ